MHSQLLLLNAFTVVRLVNGFSIDSNISVMSAKVSASVTLSCKSPSSWFFCVWEGPRGDRVCALREGIGNEKTGGICGNSDRLKISG